MRLDGLPSEYSQGWCDYRDSESGRHVPLGCARGAPAAEQWRLAPM